MKRIYRFLGKRGRTTIPLPLRQMLGLRPQDMLSCELLEDGDGIVIRKESLCDACFDTVNVSDLSELIESMDASERYDLFLMLLRSLGETPPGGDTYG